MPDGITQTPEGENYRKFYFLYYTPENGAALREALKGVKELFASKDSKEYYRIYRTGFALTRFLSSRLFEVSATDPTTFAAVAAGIGLTALVACLVPARRAARLDPVTTLRAE
jgi:hypothetical protein